MSQLNDPIRESLQRGWNVLWRRNRNHPGKNCLRCGHLASSAGTSVIAELLARTRLQMVMTEEGPLTSNSVFKWLESTAYPALSQESAARKTEDKVINILQGRCVGGQTTMNWTSSLPAPASMLKFWQDQFGLDSYTEAARAPYFAQAEQQMNIVP